MAKSLIRRCLEGTLSLVSFFYNIFPISGVMLWYQKFEYVIANWFLKAAEHVLACPLCPWVLLTVSCLRSDGWQRDAQVHQDDVWATPLCPVWSGRRSVAIHTVAQTGLKTIHFQIPSSCIARFQERSQGEPGALPPIQKMLSRKKSKISQSSFNLAFSSLIFYRIKSVNIFFFSLAPASPPIFFARPRRPPPPWNFFLATPLLFFSK